LSIACYVVLLACFKVEQKKWRLGVRIQPSVSADTPPPLFQSCR
jgi:hypothetical protein